MSIIQRFALTVAEQEDASFFEKFWQTFREIFIESSDYYEHLGINSSTLLSVRLIILGLFVGMALATFVAVFNKRVLGDVVRRILSKNALSPDTALTLEELGYGSNLLVRFAVKKSTSLRRVVKCREEVAYNSEMEIKEKEYAERKKDGEKRPKFKEVPSKVKSLSDSFYIPEDMKYMADIKFEKKGTTWLGAVIIVIALAAVFLAVMYFLPYILSLVNDFAATFESSGNNKIL